ncbi:MAG: ornithine cyclodeaminase family protein [Hyphomicrobiales bacterium]|nr:ornithine cyclodeaminase family protein [Hyphomicrobiales bacterium]
MRQLSADDLRRALPYGALVDRLADDFRAGCTVPLRHHHTVEVPGGDAGTLLLMPAWQAGEHIGIKLATVFPGNGARGLPAVMATYLLLDGTTGAALAMIDGAELTLRRTACASALAARFLARADSAHLLVVGTGRLAPHLARAHASQRPITAVTVWGRDPDKAAAVAEDLRADGLDAAPAADLEAAVAGADIVTCATLASDPLVHGAWLRPGQHLDLVGGFTPAMREADDEAVRRARVYVDTREGACKEAGDIAVPLANGVLDDDDIQGDLFDLTRGRCDGRGGNAEITLFKSVGTALEDLSAARLAVERA